MAIIFYEDWQSYAVGAVVPGDPGRLGGLWYHPGFFGASVTDESAFLSTKSLKFGPTGAIAWNDALNSYNAATFRYAFRGDASSIPFQGSLQIFDAMIPVTVPWPQPIPLFTLRFESDNTLSAYGPSGGALCNSGKSHNGTGPYETVTTQTWSADNAQSWYYLQLNISFDVNLGGFMTISLNAYIDRSPILAGTFTTTLKPLTELPHSTPPTFNTVYFNSSRFFSSYIDNILFDGSASIPPYDGLADAFGRITQGVIEPVTLPDTGDLYARVSQGVIELNTLPDNNARVTQAVIELLVSSASAFFKKWRIYEA